MRRNAENRFLTTRRPDKYPSSGRRSFPIEFATGHMATPVTVDDETKALLDRLQAEIRLETGREVTQQEILARVVESASESKAEFVESFRETTVPVSDADREAFHDEMIASGVETEADDIDTVVNSDEFDGP